MVVSSLKGEKDIRKIILFGSFNHSHNPNDMDLAIFTDSNKNYLSLALAYRKKLRNIMNEIPIDIIPLKIDDKTSTHEESNMILGLHEGEVIYEKNN